MKIAFFGSSLVSAYWNGAATYWRGITAALAARGHEVQFFEPDAYDRQAHRDLHEVPWAEVHVYPAAAVSDALRAVQRARAADVVVKCSGVGVFDEELEAGVLLARAPGQAVVYWDVDAPATLDRLDAQPADPLRTLLPRFDAVLTYGGGAPVADAFARLGARACVPIYNALDPATHHPAPPRPQFAGTLGLLANRLPDREQRVGRYFFDCAATLPNERFVLGGSGWHDHPRLAELGNVAYLGHVYTRDHNTFNGSPRLVLNVSRDSMARYGYSPATRVFEAAGAGACLITDRWPGIDTFLDPGTEILVADAPGDVVRLVSSVTEAQARAIGAAALRRVRRDHTYDRRAAEVEQVLDELVARRGAGGVSEAA